MYLNIKCDNEIEVEALTLVGASTKRGNNTQIGQFGTGNKFALAYLLRNGHKLRVFSGEKELVVETTEKTLRENKYDVIVIDGQETSITTQMGKDWNLWQSLREIYCNAIDEGNEELRYQHDVAPKAGETHFYIEKTDEIDDFFFNKFNDYFSKHKKVLFENKYGQILQKNGDRACIYRRGVRCHDTNENSLYDYNFNDVMINENRMLYYSWDLPNYVYNLLLACDDEEIIKNVLINQEGMLESKTDSSISYIPISETFKEVVKGIKIVPINMTGYLKDSERPKFIAVSSHLYDRLKQYLSDDNLGETFKTYADGLYRDHEPNEEEEAVIDKALTWFKAVDFYIPYVVKTAIFDDKDKLGSVDQETILISDVCISNGYEEIVKTIMEEYIHIKYRCMDETRTFQNSIINEFFSYMNQKSPT